MNFRFPEIAILLSLLSTPSMAEMQALRQLMIEGAEPSYAAIRCAVLHMAPVAYAGSDRFDPEHVRSVTDYFDLMTSAATTSRIETSGGSLDAIEQGVFDDAGRIMTLYLDRFAVNYATTGQAFGSDEIYLSDLAYCETVFGGNQ